MFKLSSLCNIIFCYVRGLLDFLCSSCLLVLFLSGVFFNTIMISWFPLGISQGGA